MGATAQSYKIRKERGAKSQIQYIIKGKRGATAQSYILYICRKKKV